MELTTKPEETDPKIGEMASFSTGSSHSTYASRQPGQTAHSSDKDGLSSHILSKWQYVSTEHLEQTQL